MLNMATTDDGFGARFVGNGEALDGLDGYTYIGFAIPPNGEPYRCPKCGSTRLEALHPTGYVTAIRCPDDKLWTSIHEG